MPELETLAAPSEDIRKRLSSLFKGMMKSLFKEKGAEFRVELVADPAVQEFVSTHASAMNSAFEKVSMTESMRRRLTRSNYIFSGMKAFHELHEAFPSLLDENGNRKPFEQFLNDVQSIDSTYNGIYLRAEYNFVSASAEMAGRWEQFMRDGDRYNLQYRTQHDDKVRPEHDALDRVTLPPSDSFWEEFYPPNGWNCRCTVVQVRKSKYPATNHDEAMRLGYEALQRDTKGIFRFNAGMEGKSVPDYNPYTIRKCTTCPIAKGSRGGKLTLSFVPDNEVCAACKYIRSCMEFRREPGFVDFRKSIVEGATKFKVKHTNLVTGNFYQTKKSFKRGIAHAMNIEEAEMFSKINSHISDLVYVRESPLGEVKDMTNPKAIANIKKKRERGVTGYNIYELQLDGGTWIIKTEVFRGYSEAIYHIMKKE